jgi:uncharacterized protein YgiM (DUF1202 family)
MYRKRILFSFLVLCLAIINCNLPAGQSNQPSNQDLAATITALAGSAQTGTVTPTSVSTQISATLPASATPCTPLVTANSAANVRKGPGTVYDVVGSLTTGETAGIAGENSDGTWWYINFPAGDGGHAWVSASLVTPSCAPSSVAVIAAPPTDRKSVV